MTATAMTSTATPAMAANLASTILALLVQATNNTAPSAVQQQPSANQAGATDGDTVNTTDDDTVVLSGSMLTRSDYRDNREQEV